MELLEVFYAPDAAFARLREKKWAWVLPAVLIMILSVATMAMILNKFSVMDIMEESMSRSGQEMPAGAMDQAAGFLTVTMYASPLITVPGMILILALVLLGIIKGFAGETSFPRMLNAVTYAMWPWTIAGVVLMAVMLAAAPDLRAFNLENPIPLNAGYFFGADAVGKGFAAMLSGINLLNFYFIYLLSVGAAQLSERVSTGKVAGPLIGVYVLWTLGKAGFAALLG